MFPSGPAAQFDVPQAKARAAQRGCDTTVDRLGAIIAEADQAQRLLQTAIAADGGMALAKYGSGAAIPASESDIAEMIAYERKSRYGCV